MATPTLKAVPVTGPAPSFAEPVEIYDLPAGGGAPPAWGDVTDKPATFAPAAHNQAATTITVAAIPNLTGANVQLALADLAAKVKALQDAAG